MKICSNFTHNDNHQLIMGKTNFQQDRRAFLKTGGIMITGLLSLITDLYSQKKSKTSYAVKDIRIDKDVSIEAENGTVGIFSGSPVQDLSKLKPYLPLIKKALQSKDIFDYNLHGELLWETVFPGQAKLFADGIDALTGEVIGNKARESRHTPTGAIFAAFSTIDIALWDLRGKILGKPAYRIMGSTQRDHIPVYWRPGEATMGLDEACQRAKAAYDKGYHYQKWYFTKSSKDGKAGLKENIELARRLREELPDAHLMFDNHSIRYYADVDYSLELCKAVAQYNPYWIEEPLCPECLDGYARIKGETGLKIAGGEHMYTRWPVKAFLDKKCIDFLQCDPTWCGGISEWLKICDLARTYPGVKVVPHITSPWLVAPHCVASQPEDLCPILEYNVEGGKDALDDRMSKSAEGMMVMKMPEAPGIS
jgi:L-alanine-DL-glutamate epimerase-like enolase superfamily enzyme